MTATYDFDSLRGSYLYGPGRRIDPHWRSGRWAEPIDRLLGAGYTFADCGFGSEGVLFRGLPAGLGAALASGCFGPLSGDTELARVEQVMNLVFLSNEPSDAVSVAGLYADAADAAIVVIPARVFAEAAAQGAAAVLAIGDAGLVFRYPLLARTIALSEVLLVAASRRTLGRRGNAPHPAVKLLGLDAGDRAGIEQELMAALAARGLAPARPVGGRTVPRRV